MCSFGVKIVKCKFSVFFYFKKSVRFPKFLSLKSTLVQCFFSLIFIQLNFRYFNLSLERAHHPILFELIHSHRTFFKKEFFKEFGNLQYTVDSIKLDRTDKVNTPTNSSVLKEWNTTTRMLMRQFIDKDMLDRIFKLSDEYRVSDYMIEAERGLMTPISIWGTE